MSTTLEQLRDQANAFVKLAKDAAEAAHNANRPMSDDERHAYDENMAKAQTLVPQIRAARADMKALTDAQALADSIGATDPEQLKADLAAQTKGDPNRPTPYVAKSLGEAVVEAEAFKRLLAPYKGRKIPQGASLMSDPIELGKSLIASTRAAAMVEAKALITGTDSTLAGAFVVNERADIVETLGRRQLTIRNLVSVRRTNSDTVEYVRQTAHTNNAAVVDEATTDAAPTQSASTGPLVKATGGGYKPAGSWAWEVDSTNVKTIAEMATATKRALSDVAQMEGLINDELIADIAEAEENEILNGDGTGSHFTGIMATSGLQSQAKGADTMFDAIRKGLTKARTVGRTVPTGIVMNPAEVEKVDLAKDGNQRYYGAGPFTMGPRTLWGVPVVESEAQTAGTALLGDFRKAVLWDREQTAITMTNSHEDYFARNLVAILGEERLAFAVTRPTAFVKVTGL